MRLALAILTFTHLLLLHTVTAVRKDTVSPNPKAILQTLQNDADDDTAGWQVEEGTRRPKRDLLEGRPCMTVERLRSADNETEYLECAPLSKEELNEFKLTQKEKYLGVWVKRSCPSTHTFEEERQKCRDPRMMRRQPLGCNTDPYQIGCGVPCPASNMNPIVGGTCNWMNSNLLPDPSASTAFLYCAQTTGQTCGEWTRVPCASGVHSIQRQQRHGHLHHSCGHSNGANVYGARTDYDTISQLCVPTMNIQRDSICGSSSRPVCQCAQSDVQSVCPGTSNCQNSYCCVDIIIGSGAYPLPPSPLPPILSPPIMTPSPVLPPIVSQYCPNSYSPPIGNCGSCPQNTACNPGLNSCCPNQNTYNPPSTGVTVLLICPTGQTASSACGMNGACPTGTGCYNGGCCPMTCPQGQNVIGFCNQNGCGNGNCYAESGCCCRSAEPVMLPVCQNGVQSITRCNVDSECSMNQRCSNGGCCPMPFCPNGVQSTTRCLSNTQCGTGMSCSDGACCPLPRCSNGIYSLSTCTRSLDCGRPGVECVNGGCCPLPQCPGGGISSQRCPNNGMCPAGSTCLNGGCCSLPTCPSNGMVAASSCQLQRCGGGFECVSGGCCPLPQCPTGALANQRCQLGAGCSPGNVCENGVCCPLPQCSIGVPSTGVCGMANSCPIGYVCEGRGCCPEPMPLCPNGGRATMRCTRGSECPPGFGCTPLGGCCLLSMEPAIGACPSNSNAVCQCSANNGCPMGASCNMGTCCSSAAAPLAQVPGSSCVASPQCNGFSSSCSQCVQGVCICTTASASNGVTCMQMTPVILQSARSGCDQYGSPCKYVLSSARRRPIFAPTGNITAEPLFYNVARSRRCVNASDLISDADATCLPNEKCIEGVCRQKLWPGEYGCQVDDECSARCPNTYCEKRKTDKGVPQCQCKEGLLLHGRCFTVCPSGFHESGASCVQDDEDAFWKSAESQDRLRELLNKGEC